VAATTERRADRTDVDGALGADRHLEAALDRVALEHDGDLGLLRHAQHVDDPLDVGEPQAADLQVVGRDGAVHQAEARDRGRLERGGRARPTEQLDVAERRVVVDRPRDEVVADAGPEQPGGEVVDRRRGREVLERAGVGDQAGVEADGEVVRQRHAEPVDEVGDEDRSRGGARVDEVDAAEVGVAGVVVDDDAAAGGVDPVGERAEPVGAAGVERDEQLRRCGTCAGGTSSSSPGR
jgi:hypothetical protein